MGGAAGTKLLLLQFLPTFLLKNINFYLYLGVVRVPLLLLSCYNPQHLEKKQGVATVREHQLFNKLWLSRTLSFGNRK